MIARDRNTSRMDLCVARVGEIGALFMRAPRRRDIAIFCIRRQEENIGIAAGTEHDRMRCMRFDFSVTRLRTTIPRCPSETNHIQHLGCAETS